MKSTFFRIAAVLTAAVVMVTFSTGCRSGDGTDRPDGTGGGSEQGESEDRSFAVHESEYAYYIAETFSLPGDIGEIYHIAYHGNKFYFSASELEYVAGGDETAAKIHTSIYSINTDGTGLARLADYSPKISSTDEAAGINHIYDMCFDGDGSLWVVEAGNFVRKLDSQGAELISADMGSIQGIYENSAIRGIAVDNASADGGAGNVYLIVSSSSPNRQDIFVLDNDGDFLFSRQVTDYYFELTRLPDGTVAYEDGFYYEGKTGYQLLREIDAANKTLGDAVMVPVGEVNYSDGDYTGLRFFPGAGSAYDLLVSDGIGLYGCAIGEPESVMLLSWFDIGITNPNAIADIIADGDEIICIEYLYTQGGGARLPGFDVHILGRMLRSEMPEVIELTLATINLNFLDPLFDLISDFNAKNPGYRINLVEYAPELRIGIFDNSTYYSIYYPALERFKYDIISDNIPDILITDRLPYAEYAEAGLFADLYPFIDADPEISRDDFVPKAFQTAEINGGLYRTPYSFLLMSVVGNPAILGSDEGWTLEEFEAVLDAHPGVDMPMGYTTLIGMDFLQRMIALENERYFDFEAGTVHFDNPYFIKLLEISNRVQRDFDSDNLDNNIWEQELIGTGRQIMNQWLIRFDDNNKRVYDEQQNTWFTCFDEVVIKGFPSEDGNGHMITGYNQGFAISENSLHKDAAWEFVRTVLTYDWQIENATIFPSNKTALNKRAQEAVGEHGLIGNRIDVIVYEYTVTQEDVDTVMALIDSARVVPDCFHNSTMITDIFNIISEHTADYYNGLISAEDAARLIQSRTGILVAERN